MRPVRASLDASRWHLQHGPIDLIVGAHGDAAAVKAAHDACWMRFATVLDELVAELPLLKRPISADATHDDCPLRGSVAQRMWDACHAHRTHYITPMAAVAGSVADELIEAFRRPGIARAFVNNGGDIALHLTDDESYRIGMFPNLAEFAGPPSLDAQTRAARLNVQAASAVRGVATSGWRGRSFSLGIADSVTVLARDAAQADAAATIIANAVDVEHAGIVRRSASALKDDTDLGERLVTVDVPPLPQPLVDLALARGVDAANRLRAQRLIEGGALFLQQRVRVAGLDRSAWQRSEPHAASQPEVPCTKYAAC